MPLSIPNSNTATPCLYSHFTSIKFLQHVRNALARFVCSTVTRCHHISRAGVTGLRLHGALSHHQMWILVTGTNESHRWDKKIMLRMFGTINLVQNYKSPKRQIKTFKIQNVDCSFLSFPYFLVCTSSTWLAPCLFFGDGVGLFWARGPKPWLS